jgi:hypothetical protein
VQIANSLTEQCGHKTFQIFGFWADYGQPAPYPSLAVRARNGRVADHPEVGLVSFLISRTMFTCSRR